MYAIVKTIRQNLTRVSLCVEALHRKGFDRGRIVPYWGVDASDYESVIDICRDAFLEGFPSFMTTNDPFKRSDTPALIKWAAIRLTEHKLLRFASLELLPPPYLILNDDVVLLKDRRYLENLIPKGSGFIVQLNCLNLPYFEEGDELELLDGFGGEGNNAYLVDSQGAKVLLNALEETHLGGLEDVIATPRTDNLARKHGMQIRHLNYSITGRLDIEYQVERFSRQTMDAPYQHYLSNRWDIPSLGVSFHDHGRNFVEYD